MYNARKANIEYVEYLKKKDQDMMNGIRESKNTVGAEKQTYFSVQTGKPIPDKMI